MKRSTKRSVKVLIFILCLLTFLCIFAQIKVIPKSRGVIDGLVKAKTEMEISRVVYENMKDGDNKQKTLYTYEKDSDGKIIAIKSNPYEIAHLKSSVLYALNKTSLENKAFDIKIPLGTLFSSNLFIGRGPNIKIRVNPVGSFSAKTRSEFSSAGINQTKHTVCVNIKAELCVALPFGNINTSVESDVVIAETVIVGTVPQYVRGAY